MGLQGLVLGLLLLVSGRGVADDAEATPAIIVNQVGFTSNQFPGTATRDAQIAIDYWFKLMSDRQRTKQVSNTKVYPTIREMRVAMVDGDLDIVSILTQDYLAIRDEIPLEPCAIATRSKDGLTKWAIFVSRKSSIQSLDQLLGGRIIFDRTEGDEFGRIWFETVMMRGGLNPSGFASEEFVEKASQAILPVYFGQATACVAPLASFNTMVEMNPAIGSELVALEMSPALAPGVLCFTTQIDPSRKPEILDTLITLHEDPQGQQVLNLFRRDRIYLFEEAQIEPAGAILEEHRALAEAWKSGIAAAR